MKKITTFLTYAARAEDAANFYASIFPNSRITRTTRYPDGKFLTAELDLNGQEFIVLNGGSDVFKFSLGISLAVECESQEEIDRFWDALTADGGAPGQCGWLTDKFGVSWQIVPSNVGALLNGPNGDKVLKAVMTMTKLDLNAMKRAAAGA